jgi:hypothetical protein
MSDAQNVCVELKYMSIVKQWTAGCTKSPDILLNMLHAYVVNEDMLQEEGNAWK